MPDAHGAKIFISYRRDDAGAEAGRLSDDLQRAFGDDSVFLDVVGIQLGRDFRKAIHQNVGGCGVLLAVIGPQWATIKGPDGTNRLSNANDYVRLEIATALQRDIPVVPVLVRGATLPNPNELPEDLQEMIYRNSVELTHTRWHSDVGLLITALQQLLADLAAENDAKRNAEEQERNAKVQHHQSPKGSLGQDEEPHRANEIETLRWNPEPKQEVREAQPDERGVHGRTERVVHTAAEVRPLGTTAVQAHELTNLKDDIVRLDHASQQVETLEHLHQVIEARDAVASVSTEKSLWERDPILVIVGALIVALVIALIFIVAASH